MIDRNTCAMLSDTGNSLFFSSFHNEAMPWGAYEDIMFVVRTLCLPSQQEGRSVK